MVRARHVSFLVLLAAACGEDGTDVSASGPFPNGGVNGAGATATTGNAAGTANFDGAGAAGGGVNATTGAGVNGTGDVGVGGGASAIPCEVQTVLDTHCATCHANPPQFGAPMSLTTVTDFQAGSAVYPGTSQAERVLARINADPSVAMPPPSQEAMPQADRDVLANWIAAGLPAGQACGTGGDVNGGLAAPTTGGSATGGGSTAGGVADYETPDEECDYLFELRAHGRQVSGDTTPYTVNGLGTDTYTLFYFTPPWTEDVHTLRVDSLVDNAAILHHWLLYQEPNSNVPDGAIRGNIGLHSADSQLLTGWAPGNNGLKIQSDVGVKTIKGPNQRFAIEIHYYTPAGTTNRQDRSGARVCATRNLRPKEAAVHWLGQDLGGDPAWLLFGKKLVHGVCKPRQEAHILSYSPHMHKVGTHMVTKIKRANGSVETLTDRPFAFEDQAQYRVDDPSGEVVVGPGDELYTTCVYSQNRPFGPGSDVEMCYNFILAWPAGALSSGVGAVGGQNSCIAGTAVDARNM